MTEQLLRVLRPDEVRRQRVDPIDEATIEQSGRIIADVLARGSDALREYALRFAEVAPDAPLVLERRDLQDALDVITEDEHALLERTAGRIERFASAQRASLSSVSVDVPGGRAYQDISPVGHAGCYAPGGRFPLPSSVLMTAVTARVAGVRDVTVASPKPTAMTLAAAAVARADRVLCVGGAHAIAALAYGVGVPTSDVIVGPGNRFVTAAKKLVAGRVGIDMIAGPSELLVVADDTCDPAVVASDLIAQAEHDPDALPILVSWSATVIAQVREEVASQLTTLPTRATAIEALRAGFSVLVRNLEEAVRVSDDIAPEHLQLSISGSADAVRKFSNYGGAFAGHAAAEVFGDYGIGPNHVLPTSGASRFVGGLSVFTFLRVRTVLELQHAEDHIVTDAAALARHEGLEGHARAALARKTSA